MNCNELMIGDWYLASEQHSTMDGDYTLEFYPKKLTIDDLVMPVKYVHEFQHALRLCGLNDLSNNFKI